MRQLLFVAACALLLGIAVDRYLLPPPPLAPPPGEGAGTDEVAEELDIAAAGDGAPAPGAAPAPAPMPAEEPPGTEWRVASTFPGDLIQFGTLGRRLAGQIALISDGAFTFAWQEPGAPLAPEACFEAAAAGEVEACWSSPAHWIARERALGLFAGAPFGPSAREYAAWLYQAGGLELMNTIYARHGLVALICGVAAPEAGGWFRREITSVEDLAGLRMRIFGLGARVVEKLGVTAVNLPGGAIAAALASGEIDASEYSMPAVDVTLGLEAAAGYYYFPGWQQQSTLFELLVNGGAWQALDDVSRVRLAAACGDNFRAGLAEGEAIQGAALAAIAAAGVEIRRWPPPVLAAFERAWHEVAAEEAAADPSFKLVWDHLSSFRAGYAEWRSLGHLP